MFVCVYVCVECARARVCVCDDCSFSGYNKGLIF